MLEIFFSTLSKSTGKQWYYWLLWNFWCLQIIQEKFYENSLRILLSLVLPFMKGGSRPHGCLLEFILQLLQMFVTTWVFLILNCDYCVRGREQIPLEFTCFEMKMYLHKWSLKLKVRQSEPFTTQELNIIWSWTSQTWSVIGGKYPRIEKLFNYLF